MIHRLTLIFATGLGTGYSPVASGTVGTVLAIPLFIILSGWGTAGVLTGLLTITVLGVPAADYVEKYTGTTDPGRVVIDEIAGFLLTMTGSPVSVRYIVAGFLLFRFFDIVKPPPIKQADRGIRGGLGVMVDDLLAGVYAWIFLRLLEKFPF